MWIVFYKHRVEDFQSWQICEDLDKAIKVRDKYIASNYICCMVQACIWT